MLRARAAERASRKQQQQQPQQPQQQPRQPQPQQQQHAEEVEEEEELALQPSGLRRSASNPEAVRRLHEEGVEVIGPVIGNDNEVEVGPDAPANDKRLTDQTPDPLAGGDWAS